MKKTISFLLEVFPLAIFFIANSRAHEFFPSEQSENIFYATSAFMIALVVCMTIIWIINRKIAIMPIITLVVVLIFGGLTLYLHDETFIKLKPTIVNLIFASILFGGLLFGKNLISYVMEAFLNLDEAGWRKLNILWASFFVFLALLNEVIWRNFSTDVWVDFKVFGIMPLTIIFSMFTMYMINDHQIEEDDEELQIEQK